MYKHYSKLTGAFYADDLREVYEAAGSWPSDAVPVTAEQEFEIRMPERQTSEQIEEARVFILKFKIQELEAKQPRMIRELALVKHGALDRLQALDSEISALRAQINGA